MINCLKIFKPQMIDNCASLGSKLKVLLKQGTGFNLVLGYV